MSKSTSLISSSVLWLALFAGLILSMLCRSTPETVPYPAQVRGHQEVMLEFTAGEAVGAIPLFLGSGGVIGLCLDVPATVDTSSWKAVLEVGGQALQPEAPPAGRSATTVCFDARLPAGLRHTAVSELCGTLADGATGRVRRLPCRGIETGDASAWKGLDARLGDLLAKAAGLPIEELTRDLDELADEARSASLPLLAVRIELITVHFLSLAGDRAQARARLDAQPRWLDEAAASHRAAQVAYMRAQVALLDGRRADAWQALAEADRLHRRTADPESFTVAMQRAELLSDAGAGHEAVLHLGARLAECGPSLCDPGLLAAARLQMARLVLADPFRSRGDVEAARRTLALDLPEAEPERRVLILIVEAALNLDLGGDPGPALSEARDLLPGLAEGPRGASYAAWIRWLEGQAALVRGEAATALAACLPLATRLPLATGGEPSIAGWAWSCVARAYRLRGDLAAADLAFDKALAHHEHAAAAGFGVELAGGLGPQAEDTARAAGVAVDRGHPERAWELLVRIDQRSTHEARRLRCREAARDADVVARWRELDRESESLLADLADLSLPASLAREAEIEPVRRALQERLLTVWRTWPGCAGAPESVADGADLRAFVLDDEVILLGRREGRITTLRRTPLGRAAVGRLADEVTIALTERSLGDEAWRALLAPAAEALLPPDLEHLGPRLTYALHGRLQELPLAALPVEGLPATGLPATGLPATGLPATGLPATGLPATGLPATGLPATGRWLGDLTAVAVQPAGAQASSRALEAEPATPLFVVDPLGDLPHAGRSVASYRRRFPDAWILERSAASRRALLEHADGAAWLHLDTHAAYEAGFPELSSLLLADGPLSFIELAAIPAPRRFANLSGCRTGTWYSTADSGRYGLGGLMARLGVPWTVATRAALPDRLAKDYNDAFYAAIADGVEAPEAHRSALSLLRSRYPAAAWAALLLIYAPTASAPTASAPSAGERPAVDLQSRKTSAADS